MQALRHRPSRRARADHDLQGLKRDFKIIGMLKDVPKNSSMKINAILRLDFNRFYANEPAFPDLLGLPVRLGLC